MATPLEISIACQLLYTNDLTALHNIDGFQKALDNLYVAGVIQSTAVAGHAPFKLTPLCLAWVSSLITCGYPKVVYMTPSGHEVEPYKAIPAPIPGPPPPAPQLAPGHEGTEYPMPVAGWPAQPPGPFINDGKPVPVASPDIGFLPVRDEKPGHP